MKKRAMYQFPSPSSRTPPPIRGRRFFHKAVISDAVRDSTGVTDRTAGDCTPPPPPQVHGKGLPSPFPRPLRLPHPYKKAFFSRSLDLGCGEGWHRGEIEETKYRRPDVARGETRFLVLFRLGPRLYESVREHHGPHLEVTLLVRNTDRRTRLKKNALLSAERECEAGNGGGRGGGHGSMDAAVLIMAR